MFKKRMFEKITIIENKHVRKIIYIRKKIYSKNIMSKKMFGSFDHPHTLYNLGYIKGMLKN